MPLSRPLPLRARSPYPALTSADGLGFLRPRVHASSRAHGSGVGGRRETRMAAATASESIAPVGADRERTDARQGAEGAESSGKKTKAQPKENTREWENRARKRNVAFFYGYVGTHYQGNMINEDTAKGKTLEFVLFKAIHDMGGVLSTNFPDPKKVRLNRASRTDKGVHALANVMTLKLECPHNYWIDGKDGGDLVDAINAHLPEEVRVFSATPVTKGFAPRAFCNTRTYDFYIPAPVLGIGVDEATGACVDGEGVEKSLEKFNAEVLPLFTGFRPYHNFTVKRLYTKKHRDKLKTKLNEKHARMRMDRTNESGQGSGGDPKGGDGGSSLSQEEGPGQETPPPPGPGEAGEREVEIEKFCYNLRWFHSFNAKTRLDRAHYRNINSVTCGTALVDLAEGNQGPQKLALRVSIQGESFMYHQIRHMIGLMIAAYRKMCPTAFISAVLSAPANVVLPFAPAHTLVLKNLSFLPFAREDFHNRDEDDRLRMTERGKGIRREFEARSMRPALAAFLGHEDWTRFEEELRTWHENLPEDQVARFLATHDKWSAELREKREKAKTQE